jgi:hypothetical protein
VLLYLISTAREIEMKKPKVKRKPAKKPLPVGLTEEQHDYLESKNIGKGEYMRNLLVIDMEKNK